MTSPHGASKVKTLFPYVGEPLLQAIISEQPSYLLSKLGRRPNSTIDVLIQRPLLFPQARVRLDGAQRIDLGLLINGSEVIALEVKLGKTGLGKAKIDKWLTECSLSKHPTGARLAGNMLAVLSRCFDNKLVDELRGDKLHVEVESGQYVPLSNEWGIIARQIVISSWKKTPPNFDSKVIQLSLEKDILRSFGKERFNELCKNHLWSDDYYADWIGN